MYKVRCSGFRKKAEQGSTEHDIHARREKRKKKSKLELCPADLLFLLFVDLDDISAEKRNTGDARPLSPPNHCDLGGEESIQLGSHWYRWTYE